MGQAAIRLGGDRHPLFAGSHECFVEQIYS